jgi:hypothetical protein
MDNFGIIQRGCIYTHSGKLLNILDPDEKDIDIESIGAALSKICRFGGHLKKHYSVAEHSVLATREAINNNEYLEICRGILLHDAAEAYLGDVVKPLKNELKEYLDIEFKLESVIERKFNVKIKENWSRIKKYDNGMFALENETLRGFKANLNKDEYIEIKYVSCDCWDHNEAFKNFVNACRLLGIKD